MSFKDELNALKKQPESTPSFEEKKAAEVANLIIGSIKTQASQCPANQKLSCYFTVYCGKIQNINYSFTHETFLRNAKMTCEHSPSPMMSSFRTLLGKKLAGYGIEIGKYAVADSVPYFEDDDARADLPIKNSSLLKSDILDIDPNSSYTVFRTEYGYSFKTDYVMCEGKKIKDVKTETSLVLFVRYIEK